MASTETCPPHLLLPTHHIHPSTKKLHSILKGKKKHWINRASIRTSVRSGRLLEWRDQESKTTMISMLRNLTEKVGTHEIRWVIYAKIDILKKAAVRNAKIQIAVTEIKQLPLTALSTLGIAGEEARSLEWMDRNFPTRRQRERHE